MLEVGPELDFEYGVWQKSISHVPENYLERSYDHAAAAWDWHDTHRVFTADAIALSYSILLVEDRQRTEAAHRNAAKRDPDGAVCKYCCATGYQAVFVRQNGSWQQTARPCSCDLAPALQRSDDAFDEPEYARDNLGRYAKRSLMEKYGLPASSFDPTIFAPASTQEAKAIIEQFAPHLTSSQEQESDDPDYICPF
jgi:hypothetical protein